MIAVPTADAFAMAASDAPRGTLLGTVHRREHRGRLTTARRLGEGHRVLTAQVDSGLKYLAGSLFHDEGATEDNAEPVGPHVVDVMHRYHTPHSTSEAGLESGRIIPSCLGRPAGRPCSPPAQRHGGERR